ncbi:MAG: hypothetical protein SPI61_01640 [Ezakiella sp.]|uniref:hypothetical protein n=1 Tax=Ezakiella sp. TaxID=1935205 RepID=UPI00297630FB|nr:hypothetical protein [Ezakiella sp.]MDD7731890.1 hypothetical protein [Eubacteriales bacterium]MDY6079433.1 hypothetical protein [Ezakiella sp.]
MINFNEDLSFKQILKIIIPIIALIASLVIYTLFIKPNLNQIGIMEDSVKEKNEEIEELKENADDSVELEYDTAEEIASYDEFIDYFTGELINKKFKYGNIAPKQLDNDELIYPYAVDTKLVLDDIKDLDSVLDNASHNLTSFYVLKTDDSWEANFKNIFLMDKYYGLRNIVIDNVGIESHEEIVEDSDNKEDDDDKDEKNDDEKEENKSTVSSSSSGAIRIKENKEIYTEFEFVDFKKEDFLFSPITEGVTYDFLKRDDSSFESIILNAYNSSEEDGELEMAFDYFDRIVWVTDSIVSFDFDSLAGSFPDLKLEVLDSHSNIINLEPDFKDGKVFYKLNNLEFPVFIKGFNLEIGAESRKHFSVSNGIIAIKDEVLSKKPWLNQIYSVATLDARTVDSLMKIYNNKNKEEFIKLNNINTDSNIYNPSYFMKTEYPYEIFKKD